MKYSVRKKVNSINRLLGTADTFLNKKQVDKPLLVWFKNNLILDSFKKELLTRHPDVVLLHSCDVCPKEGQAVVFHLYLNQTNEEALKHCISLAKKGIPVIYLVNEYEREKRPNAILKGFHEIELQVRNAIILNHMFTGNYLEDNIGHEIINLFSDDKGEQYIYLCRDGKFNRDDMYVEHVVQVRRPDKSAGTLEVINIASNLEKCDPKENPMYGGVNIQDIFKHNTQQQESCVTFRAGLMRKPCDHMYIWKSKEAKREFKGDVVAGEVLNNYNPSRQLREYIWEELDESGKTVKDSNYYRLKCMIEGANSTEVVSLPQVDLSCNVVTSAAEIYGIENLELPYSNAFRYFINKYPDMFLALYKCIEDEKVIKVYREWKNIDLIVNCQKSLFVIENKIFSDLNGEDGNQLSDYHSKIEQEIRNEKSVFYGKQPIYVLLVPDHNNIVLKGEDKKNWKIVRYSEVHTFLINQRVYNEDAELKDFANSLYPHTQVDFNFSVMQKRFVRAITKCKGTK